MYQQQDNSDSDEAASPCVGVCVMDQGLCQGCFRSLREIADWLRLDANQRRSVIQACQQRRKK